MADDRDNQRDDPWDPEDIPRPAGMGESELPEPELLPSDMGEIEPPELPKPELLPPDIELEDIQPQQPALPPPDLLQSIPGQEGAPFPTDGAQQGMEGAGGQQELQLPAGDGFVADLNVALGRSTDDGLISHENGALAVVRTPNDDHLRPGVRHQNNPPLVAFRIAGANTARMTAIRISRLSPALARHACVRTIRALRSSLSAFGILRLPTSQSSQLGLSRSAESDRRTPPQRRCFCLSSLHDRPARQRLLLPL